MDENTEEVKPSNGRWVMGIWMDSENDARLDAELKAITEAERRAHIEARNVIIG